MKVFISWSGDTSHKVALAFKEWLPKVIQIVDPYVSSEDIDKGARWSSDIAGKLDDSSFGILCVTPDNVEAPWLLFEAGALGKSVENSRVCPFLFDLTHSDISGPLVQFQATINTREDVYKLVNSIWLASDNSGIEEKDLEEIFKVWWPILEKKLSAIESLGDDQSIQSDESDESVQLRILNEILDISRTNQKLLRAPHPNQQRSKHSALAGVPYLATLGNSRDERNIDRHYQAVVTELETLINNITEERNKTKWTQKQTLHMTGLQRFIRKIIVMISRADDSEKYVSELIALLKKFEIYITQQCCDEGN